MSKKSLFLPGLNTKRSQRQIKYNNDNWNFEHHFEYNRVNKCLNYNCHNSQMHNEKCQKSKKNENTVQQALKINNEVINDHHASMTMFSVSQRGCFKYVLCVCVLLKPTVMLWIDLHFLRGTIFIFDKLFIARLITRMTVNWNWIM